MLKIYQEPILKHNSYYWDLHINIIIIVIIMRIVINRMDIIKMIIIDQIDKGLCRIKSQDLLLLIL